MLKALARLLSLTAAMADREAADACVHEGVEECAGALDRLQEALAHANDERFHAAWNQEERVTMDTPDADTLTRWAEGWEQMAERMG